MKPLLRPLLRVLGIGALVAGGLTVAVAALAAALLLGRLLFWLAWNVLDFGPAIGLPELGFWAIVLATVFLVVGWFPKLVITAIVFLVDPSWFHGTARVHWPEPTFRNFVAVALSRCSRRDRTHTPTSKRAVTGAKALATGGDCRSTQTGVFGGPRDLRVRVTSGDY